MKRRKRPMRMKDGQLSISWGYTSEMGEDIYYTNGPGTSSCDARLLDYFFGYIKPERVLDGTKDPTLLDQLKERGYDLKTLKFTIQKLKPELKPEPKLDPEPESGKAPAAII